MTLHRSCLLLLPLLVLPLLAPSAYADGILGSDLSTFAILGGAGVALNGTGSVISGSVGGCCVATTVTGVIPTNFTISGGTVQLGGATATSAQSQLGAAITALTGTTTTGTVSALGGLTLSPGVYSSSSTMDLTGTLKLDGGGNANALWIFLVGSALSTASSSVVNVTNTGSGAGVYWVLPTTSGSASLGDNSVFDGNILANIAITVGTNVTDSCGRLLTQTASVTLAGTDTIGIGCSGTTAGSSGLSGGGTITPGPGGGSIGSSVAPLPFAPVGGGGGGSAVPEPGTLTLLGIGIAGLVGKAKARMRRPKVLRA
jgi:hypothetical protein